MDTTTDAAAGAAATGIVGGLIFLWLFLILIGLVFFIWWIFLLIDCTKRDFPEKSTWLIVLIVGFVFGFVWLIDIIYYFAVVKKYGPQGLPKPPAAPTTPAAK